MQISKDFCIHYNFSIFIKTNHLYSEVYTPFLELNAYFKDSMTIYFYCNPLNLSLVLGNKA